MVISDTIGGPEKLTPESVLSGEGVNAVNLARWRGAQQRLDAGGRIHEAVGANKVIETPPYPSTHNLGTNRMSANAMDGVVNKWGQTHDINNLFVSDGSQFTTSASENPTLTIVTLAIRQADYIAEQLGKGNI